MSGSIVKHSLRAVCALATLAALAAATGCGIGPQAADPGPVSITGAAIHGTVHGGQQPVLQSTIQLYAVGTTAYGAGATPLLTTTVTTGTTGSFTITGDYPCPSASTLVYITATGGNPGAGTNNNLKLAAPLGNCDTLQTNLPNVVINEVTTAAMAYALGQYFTTTFGSGSTDAFGAANTTQAQLGVTNAFATAANLVNVTNGTAVVSNTVTNGNGSVIVAPESAKLNTVANILAACVNSTGGTSGDGSSCGTLFADSPPTGQAHAPTDTLQAAVDLSLNPTSTNANGSAANLTALYGLQSATAPFAGQSTAPTDWTLGILYTDNTPSATFFLKPQNLAVDGYGNIWVLSQSSGAGALVEVSPAGVPESTVSALNTYGPFTAVPAANTTGTLSSPKNTSSTFITSNIPFTTSFGQATNNPAITPRNLAIDPSNNVWFTSTSSATSSTGGANGTTAEPASGAIFEVGTSSGLPSGSTYGFNTGKSSYGLAIDGAGDVFVSEESTSSYFSVLEFPFSSTTGAAFLTPIGYPIIGSTPGTAGAISSEYVLPEYMAFDPSGNLWIDGGSGATTYNFTTRLSGITATGIYEYNAAGNVACPSPQTAGILCQVPTSTTANTFTNYSLTGGPTEPWQPAADTNGIFIPDAVSGNSVNYVPYATPASNTQIQGSGSGADFDAPHFAAVDGAGNVWVANNNSSTASGTAPGGSVSETNSTGTLLSPATSSTTTVNPGYVHAGLDFALGIGIDPSGNVWVANSVAGPGSIFELVGAATPTVTPIAGALSTSSVGVRP